MPVQNDTSNTWGVDLGDDFKIMNALYSFDIRGARLSDIHCQAIVLASSLGAEDSWR